MSPWLVFVQTVRRIPPPAASEAEKARPRRFCVDSDGVYHLPDGVYHLPGELEAEKDAHDSVARDWASQHTVYGPHRPDFLPFLLGSR